MTESNPSPACTPQRILTPADIKFFETKLSENGFEREKILERGRDAEHLDDLYATRNLPGMYEKQIFEFDFKHKFMVLHQDGLDANAAEQGIMRAINAQFKAFRGKETVCP